MADLYDLIKTENIGCKLRHVTFGNNEYTQILKIEYPIVELTYVNGQIGSYNIDQQKDNVGWSICNSDLLKKRLGVL